MPENSNKPYNIPQSKEIYTTELQVRELIAASLANWTGITRFRTIETTILSLTDFTSSQHNHSDAANGGQINPNNAFNATLAVAGGGTGTTTSTGTGSVVLSNSPALVTPALGAASATSLTLTTDLAVADGGTGASTLTGILKGNGAAAFTAIVPLAGTKVYFVSDSSGGAVTRQLTFTDGILTSET